MPILPGINNLTRYSMDAHDSNVNNATSATVSATASATKALFQPPQPGQTYRPLNVKDALSYLDEVKIQFRNQNEVYNNFLDIMKDFKSQNIDTPGVIDRVSALFRGHPKLIDGFNTFLPEGFSIECSPTDPNTIVVTTPLGKSIRQGTTHYDLPPPPPAAPNASTAYPGYAQYPAAAYYTSAQPGQPGQALGPYSMAQIPQGVGSMGQQQPLQSLPPGVSPGIPRVPVTDARQGSPAEFDQAINYVNKIKQRYASQPDTYKRFLENLQMYQKGVKPIEDVYREISGLFRDAPDLLEDFKLFMPDTPPKVAEYGYMQLPPVGSFAPPTFADQQQLSEIESASHSRKRRGSSRSTTGNNGAGVTTGGQIQPFDEQPVSNLRATPLPAFSHGHLDSPSLLPGVPEPAYATGIVDTDISDEISFFDKVKKAIGNKQTYNEFLKFLRLYTSDVIDKDTLVEKVQGFIANSPELFAKFKAIVGWEAKPLRIENIAIRKELMDLGMRKAAGPSYRLLPKSQSHKPCSGRDELCWEIFNDEWAGHPVWASEESGFIAHRKNQYEEILFRIEDERHEYDFFMEANLRTIQTLETIANRMANMTTEEKAKFKLPANLGHTSTTIYKKVIRKVYDKDRGWEVIEALRENPVLAVPVVLKRLKQKDEEWKRAHREWNKVWREAEQKIFYKSLDHLGLAFKQMDKKLLTNKQLVNEICTIKREQTHKKIHPLMPRPKSQLLCQYNDFEVMMDVLQLIYVFLDHNQTYSPYDKSRMEVFIRSFLIRFYFLSHEFIDESLRRRGVNISRDRHGEESSEESEASSSATSSLGTLSQTRKRPREYDLLRDVLRKSKRRRNHEDDHESDESDAQRLADEEVERAQSNWIAETGKPNSADSATKAAEFASASARDEFNVFCNTQIYVFFRYIDVLYKRLLGVKNLAPAANREIKSRAETKFAKDLGLIDYSLEDQSINIKGNDSYHEALDLCVKLIQGKVEQNAFEECLRQGFLNKAFKLFTINKVIQGVLKHCHTLVTDSRCGEILMLMEKDRNTPVSTAKDQIVYRMQVRSHMHADENMFKISYNRKTSTAEIVFIAVDDLTVRDSSKTKEEKWNYYMTSYSMSYPTEGLDSSKLHVPFLKSSLEQEETGEGESEDEIEGVSDSKLKVKVDMDTYRLVFDEDSYDLFVRNSVYSKSKSEKPLAKLRLDYLRKSLEGEYGLGATKNAEEVKKATDTFELLLSKSQ
ncbi:hypothetical protein FOA43_002730 [Brettanomyces nanus]|uniref:Histone deacetylase interacting domain-containing protein n=1 Tax=Eeniella nana TaxID=13502 RepID=A0A875RV98_EENNA|nr:uncharacterized protein FOA43_002730 [Brettanomyces nanus]QPG75377.1 hypothetical protein FOA43_002730 [Brettanomyces nanus]